MTTSPRRPTTGSEDAYVARVKTLEREAMTRLAEAAGDRSLCRLSRDGSACPAAKYHEGAVAALAQARRALAGAVEGAEPADPVRAVHARWVQQGGAGTAGAAWGAYHEGGRDALDALLVPAAERPSPATAREAPPSVPGATAAVVLTADNTRAPAGAVAAVAVENAPTASRSGGGRWPRRRVAAAAVLAPVAFVLLVAAGGGLASAAPLWTVLVALVAVGAATTLATYVPGRGSGRRPDLGCSPCATMSAGTVLVAAWLLHAAPHEPSMAVAALGAVGFGLLQRLTPSGASCPT